MSYIYFFRGKAATGKTTITNVLSNELNIPVLRKDDIFDVLSQYMSDNTEKNSITYDLLAKLIQTNINNKVDLLVDIGLSKTTGWKEFHAKIDFKECRTFNFLCDCTDTVVWKNRIMERLHNPTPNQFFKTIDEAISYYSNVDIQLQEQEYNIDSCDSLDKILSDIHKVINK